MQLFNSFSVKSPNGLAKAFWKPDRKEIRVLRQRSYLEDFGRVDQIWPWLAKRYRNLLAVEAPHAAHPECYRYGEVSEKISTISAAFRSLGIESGDVVALFAENSPRWLLVDQGLMRCEAADAVRGATAPVEELQYILEDCGAVALIVQNSDLLKKLALTSSQLDNLKFLVQLEGEPLEGVIGWEDLLSAGLSSEFNIPDPLVNRGPDSSGSITATILYTSGTTGRPKGVPLSHSNLLHQMASLACVANPKPGDPVLSVLPIWHAYERSAEYYFFSCACTQSYTTIKHLKRDLPRVRPIVMVTVPRLWEAVKAGFDDAVSNMPRSGQALFSFALANSGSQRLALRIARGLLIEPVFPVRRLLAFFEAVLRWPFHGLASLVLWPKVLKKLCGGRLLFPINGGGAIAPHVDSFFESLGVELLVGYGLTETSPVVSCRRPWRNVRGSSGPPLPQTEFRIVDPESGSIKRLHQIGRVLVRGPQVMSGYLGKPEATAKVLDSDGWFDTGDLGMLLADGSLVLTGRAKDTIVLSSGENIEPGPLEDVLVASSLFDQVMLVGQDQRQLGVLVVPNVEEMFAWAIQKNVSIAEDLGGWPGEENLRSLLRREINQMLSDRKGSRPDERVLGVVLVRPFTIENGLLTQTLKQRREKIFDRDREFIDLIFNR